MIYKGAVEVCAKRMVYFEYMEKVLGIGEQFRMRRSVPGHEGYCRPC